MAAVRTAAVSIWRVWIRPRCHRWKWSCWWSAQFGSFQMKSDCGRITTWSQSLLGTGVTSVIVYLHMCSTWRPTSCCCECLPSCGCQRSRRAGSWSRCATPSSRPAPCRDAPPPPGGWSWTPGDKRPVQCVCQLQLKLTNMVSLNTSIKELWSLFVNVWFKNFITTWADLITHHHGSYCVSITEAAPPPAGRRASSEHGAWNLSTGPLSSHTHRSSAQPSITTNQV